ncbi:MAG: hypothetical protein ACKO1K_09520 [Burkholderiales bacterium]
MDATPIIFLAKLGKLDLLFEFKIPVFMPREVEFEVVEKQARKEGRELNSEEETIQAFLEKHKKAKRITVVQTIVCKAAEDLREANPMYSSNGDGEVAANSLFLNRDKYGVIGPALLLYEDADVEVVFRRDDVHFLTTYAMFVAMEKIGRLKSADDEWDRLNKVYRQKNKNDLAKHNVDRSNRGDTEYLPKAQGGGGGGKAPPKAGIRK